MGQQFTIEIGGQKVVAELLEDQAPNISKAFLQNLPCESFSVHAKFAGEELIVMVPFYQNPENEILNVEPGDIGYYPGRQTICIFYGDTKPFGKVSVFAKIIKGLDKLKPVGQKVLESGSVSAHIYPNDSVRVDTDNPVHASLKSKNTKGILSKLQVFLDESWVREPRDIENLRKHALPPMGNLPCIIYANFNTFWIGENLQVCRLLAAERKVDLSELNKTLAALLTRHAARLSKWNMEDTVSLLQSLVRYFESDGPKTYDEFVQVTEQIMVTIDRVNSWIDAIIPWSYLDKKVEVL